MKKSNLYRAVFFTSALMSILTLTGCPNPANIPTTIPDPNELNITVDQQYDLSAKTGKRAFLVVLNKNKEQKQAFIPSSNSSVNDARSLTPSTAEEIPEIVSTQNSEQYTHIPFIPPEIDQVLTPASQNDSRSLLADTDTTTTTTYTLGDTKTFYGATTSNTTSAYAADSVLKVIGNHCYVWYKAKAGITVTDTQLQTLANTFDAIYEKETYIFGNDYMLDSERPTLPNYVAGNIIDISSEQKIHIIVYDLYDDYTSGQDSGTFGYFWSLDMNKQDYAGSLNSNECECLHIDSHFLEIAENKVYSTIGHEFQHLLHFVNKTVKVGLYQAEDGWHWQNQSSTWFNEMLSMVCEDLMLTQLGLNVSAGPQSRLNQFNQTGCHNTGFGTWQSGNDVFCSYANAYAFGAFLLRNFGIDYIKTLAQNKYVDEEAVTQALVSSGAYLQSFDAALEKFYNVILNPSDTSTYSLNHSVSKTYNVGGTTGSVTFTCDAIDLSTYLTISASNMTENYAVQYYGASAGSAYYGPMILNSNYRYNTIGAYGIYVIHKGIVGTDLNTSYKLESSDTGSDNGVTYKLIFKD